MTEISDIEIEDFDITDANFVNISKTIYKGCFEKEFKTRFR